MNITKNNRYIVSLLVFFSCFTFAKGNTTNKENSNQDFEFKQTIAPVPLRLSSFGEILGIAYKADNLLNNNSSLIIGGSTLRANSAFLAYQIGGDKGFSTAFGVAKIFNFNNKLVYSRGIPQKDSKTYILKGSGDSIFANIKYLTNNELFDFNYSLVNIKIDFTDFSTKDGSYIELPGLHLTPYENLIHTFSFALNYVDNIKIPRKGFILGTKYHLIQPATGANSGTSIGDYYFKYYLPISIFNFKSYYRESEARVITKATKYDTFEELENVLSVDCNNLSVGKKANCENFSDELAKLYC